MRSIWPATSARKNYPPLAGEVHTDTLIIGGGITGISLAHELALSNHRAILVEAGRIGGGTTGMSTGNLYVTAESGVAAIARKYDADVTRQVIAARQAGLDLIFDNVKQYGLSCNLRRCSWFLSATDGGEEQREKELESAAASGLPVRDTLASKIPVPVRWALELKSQAQIHPQKYVQELAAAIPRERCPIYEDTVVQTIQRRDEGHYRVQTSSGVVYAKNVVHATHTPKGIQAVQMNLGPYREYGLAYALTEPLQYEGIFWIYENGEKYSIRTYEHQGMFYLLIVGKPHKVGQGGDNKRYLKELEGFAMKHFGVSRPSFSWGGQHYRSADLLPYIGMLKDGTYVATGYSTDGLVYGSLAAKMLGLQLLDQTDPWMELFDPRRKDILKSAGRFLKENLNVAGKLLERIPGLASKVEFAEIQEGQGKIVDMDGHKLAVYRDRNRKLVVKSAVCPHMGCVVHFNNAEETWDCPCHGSRFGTDGTVLEGPSLSPLSGINGVDGKVELDR